MFVWQYLAFSGKITVFFSADVIMSVMVIIVPLFWLTGTILLGVSRSNFLTESAAILIAIPLDMLGAVALETADSSRR